MLDLARWRADVQEHHHRLPSLPDFVGDDFSAVVNREKAEKLVARREATVKIG
ncbi:MAG: hypothetical protein ACREIW_14015 [Chthoniobacterales bacterium]